MKVIVKPRLLEILASRGLTQKKVAEAAGIPQAAISRFDKQQNHADAHLFALKAALGLSSVDELFEVTIEDEKKDAEHE
jgi:putative transcriptional regulator